VSELASLNLDFPLVIKPAVSKQFMAATKKKAYRANDKEELISLYEKNAGIIDPSEILIQELIPGRAENLYFIRRILTDGNTELRVCQARRLRQHPMDFGRASTYVESLNSRVGEDGRRNADWVSSFSALPRSNHVRSQRWRFEFSEVQPQNLGLATPFADSTPVSICPTWHAYAMERKWPSVQASVME